jgi:hypothetical protein
MYEESFGRVICGLLIRGVVLAGAVTIGAFWADGLLQASRRASDLLMTASDLQELAAAEPEPEAAEEEDDAPQAEATGMRSDEVSPTVSENGSAAARREAVAADPVSASEASGALPDHVALPPVDEPPTVETASDEPLVADDPVIEPVAETNDSVPDFGGEGTLQSFLGHAATSAEGSLPNGLTGRGPVWTIRFDRVHSAERLSAVPRTRLAAVRQRRDGAECLPIAGRQLGAAQTVDAWLSGHPEYSARRGVLLPRSWFREFDDRLLPLGGGWQFWLLVEDALFAQWIEQVSGPLAARQAGWADVLRIEARLVLAGTGNSPVWRLEITAIEMNP